MVTLLKWKIEWGNANLGDEEILPKRGGTWKIGMIQSGMRQDWLDG